MSRIYFQETQRFRQIWIWLLVVLIIAVWLVQLVIQLSNKMPAGKDPATNLALILTGIIPLGAILLLRFAKLETEVRRDGIYYRFFPILNKFRIIKQDDLSAYEAKKYNAIRDYGGWGIRTGFWQRGKAFNISGNMGVLFTFKNGKKLLLGSQKAEEFKTAIDKAFSAHSDAVADQ
jgi:hypothetical protein